MNRADARSETVARLPDYVACAIATCAAIQAYTTTYEMEPIGKAFMLLSLLGMVFSYLMRFSVQGTQWVYVGSWIGGGLALIGWLFPYSLSEVLSSGIGERMAVGGSVAWLMVLRTPALWSDSDLLFQAVPCMALFGLSATQSTELSLLLLFITFLIAVAFLLARQHQRTLLGSLSPEKAKSISLATAGPTFGLTVAAIAIATSFLLTPIVQTGMERLLSPLLLATANRQNTATGGERFNGEPELEVGSGGHADTNVLVFRVKSDRPVYLREKTFSQYTGKGWNSTANGTQQVPGVPETGGASFILTNPQPPVGFDHRERVEQTISVMSGQHEYLLTASEPIEVHANQRALLYYPNNFIALEHHLRRGDVYRVYSKVPTENPRELMQDSKSTVRPNYIRLPPKTERRIYDLAVELTAGVNTDYEKVERLRKYISSECMYSLSEPAMESNDRTAEFLFDRKKGYCDSFATALAVLCREISIPARVVRGYAPGEWDRETGAYLVREKHYHLWTEVRFENAGWVTFDATEGARAVQSAASAIADDDAATSFWRSPWVTVFLDMAIGVVALYLAYVWWRMRIADPQRISDRYAIARIYREFMGQINRRGLPTRLPHETPMEHLSAVLPHLPTPAQQHAQAIVETVSRGLFGSRLDQTTVDGLQSLLAAWRKDLKGLPS